MQGGGRTSQLWIPSFGYNCCEWWAKKKARKEPQALVKAKLWMSKLSRPQKQTSHLSRWGMGDKLEKKKRVNVPWMVFPTRWASPDDPTQIALSLYLGPWQPWVQPYVGMHPRLLRHGGSGEQMLVFWQRPKCAAQRNVHAYVFFFSKKKKRSHWHFFFISAKCLHGCFFL